MMRAVHCGAVVVGLLVPVCTAATIYVDGETGNDDWDGLCHVWDGGTCGPKATIQAGIDVAVDGDEVVVADGVYTGDGNKNLDYEGKAITVRSANGPDNCIIDCEGEGRGVHFHTGETVGSVLDGLTIINGDADFGGGICCEAAAPAITGCTISDCEAVVGGGIYASDPNGLEITECELLRNYALWDGGGIYIGYAYPVEAVLVDDCLIVQNSARCKGGGLCVNQSNPTVSDCTITANTADDAGGGVYSNRGGDFIGCAITENVTAGSGGGIWVARIHQLALTGCTIAHNIAAVSGGGLHGGDGSTQYVDRCTIVGNVAPNGGGVFLERDGRFYNCVIAGNTAFGGSGGGVYGADRGPWFVNCLVVANWADEDGGGMSFPGQEGGPDGWITNCTIVGNSARDNGGGAHLYPWGTWACTIANSVFWGNMAQGYGAQMYWSGSSSERLYMSHNNIQDGTGGVYGSDVWWQDGNLEADPLFADPDGPDNDPETWEDNDYRLLALSPCIDAGDTDVVPNDWLDLDGDGDEDEPLPDLDNRDRVVNILVDMGAYESHAGDMNCDLMRDFGDINPFVLALTDPSGYQAQYDCYDNGDCNGDGAVDFGDINPFVTLLSG